MTLSEYEVQRNENMKKIAAKMAEIDLALWGPKAPTIEKPKKRKRVTPMVEQKDRKQRTSHKTIGKRIFVVWNEWEHYAGTVTKYDPLREARPFFIVYDDGDEQWEAAADLRPIESLIELD